MINLHDVTVITSATIESVDRLRNAKLFLRYLETFCINYEVVLVEHDTETRLSKLVEGEKGVFHYFVESENCHSRAKNLNMAASVSERKYLLICDLDIFVPPSALQHALDIVRSGTDFVLPFNGVGVQIKAGAIEEQMDLESLMDRLVFFSKLHEIRPPKYDPQIFEHMYGAALDDTVGGIMLCNRRQFFMAGAMNPNMISFGCEESEFFHRIKKLGYTVERINTNNCYHYEHIRLSNSVKNNFFSSNQAELERVKAMEPGELRRYVNDGFRKVRLNTDNQLMLTNTATMYMVKPELSGRIDLSDICTVLVFDNSSRDDIRALEDFLDHMETHFDDYSIYVIEGQFSRLRMCLARKYTQHIGYKAPLDVLGEEEIRKLIYTNRPLVEIYRFPDRLNSSVLISRYDPQMLTVSPANQGSDPDKQC